MSSSVSSSLRSPVPARVLAPLVIVVAALVLAACGSSESSGGDGAGAPASGTPIPDVSGIALTDVATGDEVALGDALDAPPSTPVLAFFWAPF
jgi:hypothetical protein